MKKLWHKGYALNPSIEAFITGNDYLLDGALVKADCAASIAHAKTLQRCGVLTARETTSLSRALAKIFDAADAGQFTIAREAEDCHTAIENALTESVGEAGKKIHTGRSRNDQVQAAMRLYLKESLLLITQSVCDAGLLLLRRAREYKDIPMIGRTHLQAAMPSTVGLYLASFAEQLADDLAYVATALTHIDRSPLGSGAGYGVPLDLDRAYTARLLGFANAQNNVIAVQNSRGRLEAQAIDALSYCAATLSRFAEDFILYTLPEFGYFSLPKELCSGSSIMPQKKNPDVLELLRAGVSMLLGYSTAVRAVTKGLPSGYQRDLQLTKEPALRAVQDMPRALAAFCCVAESFEAHEKALAVGFTAEAYATDEAYRLAREESLSFRDAYVRAAQTYTQAAKNYTPRGVIASRPRGKNAAGTVGNPAFEHAREALQGIQKDAKARLAAMGKCIGALVGKKSARVSERKG